MMSITAHRFLSRAIGMLLLASMLATGLAATPAHAQGVIALPAVAPAAAAAAVAATNTDTCTDIAGNRERAFNGNGQPGLLSEIYSFIKDVVGTATQKLFSAFTDNQAYQNAVYAATVLMVVFFGIAFTIGIVQVSFQQVLTRMVKIGLIAAVISPSGWTFFSNYVVKFFMDGTDDLVKGVIQIGAGTTTLLPANATPFFQLDKLGDFLIQPDTIINIMGATFAGGPYGMMMGGLMAIAVWGFISLLIKALRVYAVTFVGRSLLLGVAPIFIVFLLFDKTRQMFTSWLQALIALSLQPILMFTFLSFFMILIESAAKDMFSAELCWTEYANVQGTSDKPAFWRFKAADGEVQTAALTWEGSIQCLIEGKTKDGKECPEFPVNIIDILSFLILVYIAQRFADVIEKIANELANTYIALDAGGKIDAFVKQATNSVSRR